jgi:hypothetical protein
MKIHDKCSDFSIIAIIKLPLREKFTYYCFDLDKNLMIIQNKENWNIDLFL